MGPSAVDARAALACPSFYPEPVDHVEVRETHGSWVFLAGEHAYKLKKPLALPFLDYSTPDKRREMCREEVRLNRRLAPDLYLGVRAVVSGGNGLRLSDEDASDAIDYVVEMRRYDERSTVAAELARGELKSSQMVTLGRTLAGFHERARRVPAGRVPLLGVARQMSDNFHQLAASIDERTDLERVLALERFTDAYVLAHAGQLEARARGGLVREVHGDLRAEHVLAGETTQIVDCIEFDQALRELDVADELGFLVMDLTAHGGERLASELVRAYRASGGDPGEDHLIAFYASHRALVRAKVALVRAGQHSAASAEHAHGNAAARDLFGVAEWFAWRARLPLVIVICGVPAAGKSHLAGALAEDSGLAHLNSDVVRKRLAGIGSAQRASAETYSADFSRLTYAELGRGVAAEAAASAGCIADATFRHRVDREAFADAFGAVAPVLFVECVAPTRVLAQRAARRDRERGAVSDATLEVVLRESRTWEPLDELSPDAHVVLRSDRPVEHQLQDLVALLDQRLGQLGAPPSGTTVSRTPARP